MRILISTILLLIGLAPFAHAEVAIIAHKSVPMDSLTQREVRDIYTGEIRSWNNGDPIVAHDMTQEGSIRESFYKFLGSKSSRVKSIWVKNLLMGEGSPPESVKSEAEVVAKVASTPGAIGFVSSEYTGDSVKILAVIPDSQ